MSARRVSLQNQIETRQDIVWRSIVERKLLQRFYYWKFCALFLVTYSYTHIAKYCECCKGFVRTFARLHRTRLVTYRNVYYTCQTLFENFWVWYICVNRTVFNFCFGKKINFLIVFVLVHQNYVGLDGEKTAFFLSVVLNENSNQCVPLYRAILFRKMVSGRRLLPPDAIAIAKLVFNHSTP